MKDEKLIENLSHFTYTRSQICCTFCNCTGIYAGTTDEAVEVFKKEGWHATNNNAYCPSCNEKRKKRVKKPSEKMVVKKKSRKRKPAHR